MTFYGKPMSYSGGSAGWPELNLSPYKSPFPDNLQLSSTLHPIDESHEWFVAMDADESYGAPGPIVTEEPKPTVIRAMKFGGEK